MEGWLNPPVVNLLLDLIEKLDDRSILVEIGSWKGKSTVLLGLASGDRSLVYAIDPHTGSHEHKELYGKVDTFEDFQKNIESEALRDKVICLRTSSFEAAKRVPMDVDLIWVDGSHDYQDVKSDFISYFPKLRVGGWMAMHDYKWQGVKKFTWELLAQKAYPIGRVRRVEDTHYFQRKASWSFLDRLFNGLLLLRYRWQQYYKNKKRRLRKFLSKT